MVAQLAVLAAGIWLMAAPAVLGYAGTLAATSDRVVGPTVAAIALLAASRILRGLRWLNLLPGLWLVAAPWMLNFTPIALVNSLAVGAAVLLLAPVGRVDQSRYGGGWASLLRDEGPQRGQEAI